MHDHSLGGFVSVGVIPNSNHSGPCNDSVFGCARCWNAANDGKGTISDCEWCKSQNIETRITPAYDEPCYYALCQKCRRKQEAWIAEEVRVERDRLLWLSDTYPDSDGEVF